MEINDAIKIIKETEKQYRPAQPLLDGLIILTKHDPYTRPTTPVLFANAEKTVCTLTQEEVIRLAKNRWTIHGEHWSFRPQS